MGKFTKLFHKGSLTRPYLLTHSLVLPVAGREMASSPRSFVIGDSFIGIFTLLNKNANMKVLKVKGGTLKGFSREGNDAQVTIRRLLESPVPFRCGLFGFGQVDMNLSFYYDLIVKQQFNDDGNHSLTYLLTYLPTHLLRVL